jgi:uncharacterized surface anchored protein
MLRRIFAATLATLLVITALGAGLAQPAQAAGTTVFLRTVDIISGQPITSACYTIVNASEEGCDENGDGLIRYQGVASGTFTVTQTERASGYLPVGDFPLTIGSSGPEEYFTIDLARSDGVNQQTADIAVSAVDSANFNLISGACFLFYGGSEEGCDENGDGQVDFQGVPVGTYLLSQAEPIDGYETMNDVWAVVASDRMIQVTLQATAPSTNATTNISIVTRDPKTGDLLKGACYIVNNASINGCDENGDGQVDYKGIPVGTFTVTQTKAPSGFAKVADFKITITGETGQVILVRQGAQPKNLVDVSIVAVDVNTGERITSASTCFVLQGGSEEGCDTNADGQVDFLGVVPGVYSVAITGNPAGYFAFAGPLSIDASADGTFEVAFIPLG